MPMLRFTIAETVKDADGFCEIRLAGRDGDLPADVAARAHAPAVPLIWQDDDAEPVGVLAVRVDAAGLCALASFGHHRRQQACEGALFCGGVTEIELSTGRDGKPHMARLWRDKEEGRQYRQYDPREENQDHDPRKETKQP